MYPVKIFVCECSCCIEEWKRKGWNQSFLKKHFQKTLKQNQFFSLKKTAVFEKKVSTFVMKKLLHPSEISVKCHVKYSFIFSSHQIHRCKKWNIFQNTFQFFCETFSNVVVTCPFRGTCLQPVVQYSETVPNTKAKPYDV